jgi:uncharacterized membrane protein YqjE
MAVELRKKDKSLGDLFSDLTSEISLLFRQEMELAKLEMIQKATRAAKNSGLLIVGIAMGYTAFLALTAAAIFALALVMPLWLSALIIGVLVGVIGGGLAFMGLKRLKRQSPVPEQTIETLKEDKRWLKTVK